MKNFKFIKIAFLFPILLLTSCATMYQPKGFFNGGYSEIVTSNDTFYVTFNGNQFTSNERALKYALRRASELTIKNGYSYFIVLSNVDHSTYTGYCTHQNNVTRARKDIPHRHFFTTGFSSTSNYGTICRPAVTLRIKCYKIPPKNMDVINAHYYLLNNQ